MTEGRLRELLQPFTGGSHGPPLLLPDTVYRQFSLYLDLLLRWNARTNLTAIRDPNEIVTRHFGEGLFTAAVLQAHIGAEATLLDLGSGAGFPGLPIQLALPLLNVTLAESQGKKAAFLHEAIRMLSLATRVWAGRVEALPVHAGFDVVTLRAVDRMESALEVAASRLRSGGFLAELGTKNAATPATLLPFVSPLEVPGSKDRVLRLWRSAA